MLWMVLKPENSGLYWLDDVYQNFYRQLFDGANFDDCFLDDFDNVLAGSQKTNDKFETVFNEYALLDAPLKARVQDIYANQMSYKQCFSSINIDIEEPGEELSDFWKEVKSLANYLYSTTLGLVCFNDACEGEADMNAHYQAFKDLNGTVCCFCGTEEMMEEREIVPEEGFESEEEKQWRASYDHYLPKKYYPFLSVDFDNLIPCCRTCNEKAKGEVDILLENGARTLAFYPYDDESTVELEASLVNDAERLIMRIDISDVDECTNIKANNWNRAFKVIPRVNNRLKNFSRSWLAPLLNGVDSVVNGRIVLQNEIHRCSQFFRQEREAYFKQLCFGEILNKNDSDIQTLISTVSEIYARRQPL